MTELANDIDLREPIAAVSETGSLGLLHVAYAHSGVALMDVWTSM